MTTAKIKIALFVTVLLLPLANRASHVVKEAVLDGVSEPATLPKAAPAAMWSGTFQTAFEDWYTKTLSLRGHLVTVDNTLTYGLFGETPVQARVMVGAGRVLFIDEDIDYFNREQRDVKAAIDTAVEELTRVRDKLAASGKRFAMVLAPSKTSLRRDEVGAWDRTGRAERSSDERVYRYLTDKLRAAAIPFVDARALLRREAPKHSFPMFAREGRHWTQLGACLVVTELGATVGAHPARGCEGAAWSDVDRWHDDFDLWRLMNVWDVLHAKFRTVVLPPAAPTETAARALFVGTSFSGWLVREARRTGTFRDIDYFYYNSTRLNDERGINAKIQMGTNDWREVMRSRDVIVLEVPEMYVPDFGQGFARQLLDERLE